MANFSKHLLALCPRRVPRNEENERNNNARRNNCDAKGGSRGKWSVYERDGRIGGARSDEMKRKGGKRERAGVFAIIIIAGFLPRMLRKQQVAALARATRNRTDKSFGVTTNRNRSPMISEPRWRLDYRRRLKSNFDCAVEAEKISKPSLYSLRTSCVISHLSSKIKKNTFL